MNALRTIGRFYKKLGIFGAGYIVGGIVVAFFMTAGETIARSIVS